MRNSWSVWHDLERFYSQAKPMKWSGPDATEDTKAVKASTDNGLIKEVRESFRKND